MGFIKKSWSFVIDPQHSGAVVAIFTVVIAATGIVYTTISILQWREMRASVKIAHTAFLAANKPSVGVSSIGAQYMGIDAAGKPINSLQPSSQTNNFRIAVEVKNFGTVAAENFVPTWKIFLNGVQRKMRPLEEGSRPSTIFPGRVVFLTGIIGAENYHAIIAAKKLWIWKSRSAMTDQTRVMPIAKSGATAPPIMLFWVLGRHAHSSAVHARFSGESD